MYRRGPRRNNAACLAVIRLSVTSPSYPQANWAHLVLIPKWVCSCTFWDPVGLSNKLSCEAGSFSCCCNPQRFLQPEVLRLYFPMLEPCVAWFVPSGLSTSKYVTTGSTSRLLMPRCPPRSLVLPCPLCPAAHFCPSYQSG